MIREFAEARELMGLREELIFNCTGLGARTLFGDPELIPIRGQLVFLLPQPEVDYCTIGPGSIYMFPRRDGILLGGSFDRDVWNTQPGSRYDGAHPPGERSVVRFDAVVWSTARLSLTSGVDPSILAMLTSR